MGVTLTPYLRWCVAVVWTQRCCGVDTGALPVLLFWWRFAAGRGFHACVIQFVDAELSMGYYLKGEEACGSSCGRV